MGEIVGNFYLGYYIYFIYFYIDKKLKKSYLYEELHMNEHAWLSKIDSDSVLCHAINPVNT